MPLAVITLVILVAILTPRPLPMDIGGASVALNAVRDLVFLCG